MTLPPILLIVAPLALCLAGLLLLAIYYDLRITHRRRGKENIVYKCRKCKRIYIERHRIPLARCPECGEQNQPARRG